MSLRDTNQRVAGLFVLFIVLMITSSMVFGQQVVQQVRQKKMIRTPQLQLKGDLTIKILRCAQRQVKPGGTIGGLHIVAKSTFPVALKEIAADLILTTSANYPAPAPYAVYSANYSDKVLLKGGRTHVNFAPNGSVNVGFGNNNEIPADTPPGNYYLGVVIDTGNKAKESNERNNVAWCKIRVVGGVKRMPDLVVPSVVFKKVKKGTDAAGNPFYIFNVIITVKNRGNANAGPFKVLLERNNAPGGHYQKACITCIIPVAGGLAAGASITLPPRQFNNANNVPSIFRATADHGNHVTESNERNNMNAVTFR
ncbi:MAG: hypothetical protein GY950_35185 [bacterium]|nr:hypothetical protein [bacterium]